MAQPSVGRAGEPAAGSGVMDARQAPASARRSRSHLRPAGHAQRCGFERVALVLQGGGALGSYQAGVFEALAEGGVAPDWVAGISIGAINSAIIAGNPPEHRVERLRAFWEMVTADLPGLDAFLPTPDFLRGEFTRSLLARTSSLWSLVAGQPGFFKPRFPLPWMLEPGSLGATSYYDTTELKSTLLQFVDFDRINRGETRLSLGAVNVRTGNFIFFDSETHRIGPEHVMASGALPPGFPPIEIAGEFYWDGGLVSNTPLAWIVESEPQRDTLVFQVDLWSSRGELPNDLYQVNERQKDIQYSSRTRMVTDVLKHRADLGRKVAALLARLPPELARSAEAQAVLPYTCNRVFNIVQLIYRAKQYENEAKDYEFSRYAMHEHWRAGYNDAVRTLRHHEIFEHIDREESIQTFDIATETSD